MADNLTDAAEARVLNWLTGNTTTAPVGPLMARLMVTNGSDASPGVEVTNAGGSTYAAQPVTFTAASAGVPASNSADLVFSNMPAIGSPGVQGVEIWDSAGTPFRWWWGPVTLAKTTNLGDPVRIPAGSLVLNEQ